MHNNTEEASPFTHVLEYSTTKQVELPTEWICICHIIIFKGLKRSYNSYVMKQSPSNKFAALISLSVHLQCNCCKIIYIR